MKMILQKSWQYSLQEADGEYLLSVISGSIGLYEQKIWLSPEEVSRFENEGADYIQLLAKNINDHPNEYVDRIVKNIAK